MFSVFRCVFFLCFVWLWCCVFINPIAEPFLFILFSLSLWLFFVMRLVVCNILCYSRLHFGSLLCKTCSHFGFGFNKTDFFVVLPLHCLVKYFSFIIWMLVLCSCNHYVALLLFFVHRKTKKKFSWVPFGLFIRFFESTSAHARTSTFPNVSEYRDRMHLNSYYYHYYMCSSHLVLSERTVYG